MFQIDQVVARLKLAGLYLVNEPITVMAGAVAAVNATHDQTWKGYAVAIVVFLCRFLVTGPFTETIASLKAPAPAPRTAKKAAKKTAKAARARRKPTATRSRVAAVTGLSVVAAALGIAAHIGTASAAFPTPNSTGVPAGAVLAPHAGNMTVSKCGTVIDHVEIKGDLDITVGNGHHTIYASEAAAKVDACVTVTNTKIDGIVDDSYTGHGFGPLYMADSEIANPPPARDVAAISDTNWHVWRSYIHGARSGGQCDGYCEGHDNYFLADVESGTAHMDALISNGAYGAPMLFDHNAFLCKPTGSVPNGSGCAADVGMFGDFSAITNLTMTNNEFLATSDAFFCLHSGYETAKPFPNGGNDVYRDNTFQSGASGGCGGSGSAVYQWSNTAGEWCRNTWSAGGNVLSTPDNCSGGPTSTVSASTTVAPTTSTTKATTTTVASTTTTRAPTTTTSTSSTTSTTVPAPTTTTTVVVTPTTECLHTAPRVCTVP